jgi:4-amino-4-deoxy-L-arabinose transferase-like glycosyltransferase
VLTLFTVRKICLNQFKDERVARVALVLLVAGTFWAEYAIGIWPHVLSAFFAVQAYWLALRHLESDDKSYALLSGLFAGLGLLFRLDAILAVPAIGLILILFTAKFLRSSFWFGLGVLPSIALISWLNMLKFGSPDPFSYGQAGGNTDVMAHYPALIALCGGFALLILWRKGGWKPDKMVVIASLAVGGIALLLIPATSAWLLRFWNGFLTLVVDIRHVTDDRSGIEAGPGGTIIFWHLAKKALGQSIPWIGLLAIMVTGGVPRGQRRFTATLLIFITVMTLPFVTLAWHGGSGSNMRYFLPILPALCILCARPILDLWQEVPNAIIFAAAGVWAVLLLCFPWAFFHPSGYVGVQQILSTYIMLATVLTAMAAGPPWRCRQAARKLLLIILAAGFLMSAAFAASDFSSASIRRKSSQGANEVIAKLPPMSLVIAFPEWAMASLPGHGSILTARDPATNMIDHQLIQKALAANYRVFVTDFEFEPARDLPPGVEPVRTRYNYPEGELIELRRKTTDGLIVQGSGGGIR